MHVDCAKTQTLIEELNDKGKIISKKGVSTHAHANEAQNLKGTDPQKILNEKKDQEQLMSHEDGPKSDQVVKKADQSEEDYLIIA